MLGSRRRMLVAAGATVASGLLPRKPRAAEGGLPELKRGQPGIELPEFSWTLPDGTVRTVADHRGRGIVLNLWATWCVPCVAEMPALDVLAGAVAGSGVVVLPLSSDRGGAAAVERFYARTAVKNLPVLLDRGGAAARAMAVRGIPTTILIDAAGRERGRVEGGADWGSAATIRMVKLLAL